MHNLIRKFTFSRGHVAGLSIIAFGLTAVIGTLVTLPLGSLSRMGPGMFPLLISLVLTGLGFVLAFGPGAAQEVAPDPEAERKSIVPFLASTASIIVFALTVDRFGFAPAVAAMSFVAGLASLRPGLVQLALLPIALAVIAALIFKVGLGLPIDLFAWPA